jgi:nucleoid-associated protein YgaU
VATPAVSLTPPVAGTTTARGQVKDWDVITYQAAQGDTFATISKDKYKDAKYEQALLKYNRDYGAGFDQNPPVLTPGKSVLIPDLSALESLYSDAIHPYTPVDQVPSATSSGTEPRVQSSTDKAPMATTPVVQVSTTTKKGSPATLSYQVRQDGETYFSIAKKTLAKPEQRWHEIFHLNGDQYDPQSPLPRGTLVRLPPDAHVERTDKP